ncbi:hypothetical protein Pelo_11663 [Pelomyxa schiedti]|nr:hypothetical protein Pelo_11663 [Pelomyxa schiedti]
MNMTIMNRSPIMLAERHLSSTLCSSPAKLVQPKFHAQLAAVVAVVEAAGAGSRRAQRRRQVPLRKHYWRSHPMTYKGMSTPFVKLTTAQLMALCSSVFQENESLPQTRSHEELQATSEQPTQGPTKRENKVQCCHLSLSLIL